MKKNKYILILVGIAFAFSLIIGTSYAIWRLSIRQESTNRYTSASCFDVDINLDENTPLSLTNAKPISDVDGLKLEPYTFTIQNTCEITTSYAINLEVLQESTLNHSYIKVSLTEETPKLLTSKKVAKEQITNATSYELRTGILQPGQKEYFSLRFWLDKDVSSTNAMNKSFLAKISVVTTATAPIYADASGAEAPILDNGLIPVVWNGNDWVKADTSTTWYNYDNQWWANALNVKEEKRDYYVSATPGTVINMEDVIFMWVWIPRYEYQHSNLGDQYAGGTNGLPGGITINFISKEITTPSSDNFTIHDAFWWDENNDGVKDTNEQLPGIWVAKFELVPDKGCEASTSFTGDPGKGCDITIITPKSIPKAGIWEGARIGTYWTIIHEKMNGENGKKIYGISNSDTHMIKNMEWGSILYLSQSKYGKFGNNNYLSDKKEIFTTGGLTGCSSGEASKKFPASGACLYSYEQEINGTGASSSGTIYGVYGIDGFFEFVMGVTKETSNIEPAIGTAENRNSGFSGKLYNGTDYIGTYGSLLEIGAKYYDVYNYPTSNTDLTIFHKGDATFETAGWYGSYIYVNGAFPWIARNNGSFGFLMQEGNENASYTTRAVLVPLK